MYQPIPAGQEKDFGNRRIYELQGGVNSEYLTGCAQVLSQDHLPSLGIVFVLLQGEQDRRQVMLEKDQTSLSQERYDLVANEGGGRSRGRGVGRGGGRRGRGGGQSNVDKDKNHCTHCRMSRYTHEYCWNLVEKPPHFNTANSAEIEKYSNEEGTVKIDMNITEFAILVQRIQALEGSSTLPSTGIDA